MLLLDCVWVGKIQMGFITIMSDKNTFSHKHLLKRMVFFVMLPGDPVTAPHFILQSFRHESH